MKRLDLSYLCRTIGSLCGFPVRLYEGRKEVYHGDHSGLRYDPIAPYLSDLFAIQGHAGTFITPIYHYYGLVRSGETRIILGPARQLPATDQQLRELAFLCDVPAGEVAGFLQSMRSLAPMPLESMQQMLCTMNYVVNDEKLNLEDIALTEPTEMRIAPAGPDSDAAREYDGVHSTLAVEQTLMNMVRKGDVEGLKGWIAQAPAVHAGPMAQEHLRQYKNTFIVATTLAARSAIRGGVSAEEALSASDLLIRNCEALQDVQSILRLQISMLLTYTEQVQRLRGGFPSTPLSLEVASYVQRHLSETISAEDMAREMHVSRPHLSRRFKEETGVTLTDYILTKKSEQAARLLAGTEKPMTAISDYLGFSSQSHFARIFHRYMGVSPSEYRLQAHQNQ